jgi:hypothetical protein
MSQREICKWLGVPSDPWPPNHYVLLGLDVGEKDLARIEEAVHQRMSMLRCYQLTHPDQVTEGMNLIAQAFSCLTDAKQKQVYDAKLLAPASATPPVGRPAGPAKEGVLKAAPTLPTPPAPIASPPPPGDEPEVILLDDEPPITTTDPGRRRFDPFAWLFGPKGGLTSFPAAAKATMPAGPMPASSADPRSAAAFPGAPSVIAGGQPVATVSPPTSQAVIEEPLDRVIQSARSSAPARRGIGTRRALFRRIVHTRQILRAWERTGKYLLDPNRKLAKSSEANELTRQLLKIREALSGFPPILGEAGQPGYLVVALARQQLIIPTFRGLLPSQREALARDWQSGYVLLVSHRDFLRQELRSLRQVSFLGRVARALRALVTDQPATVVLLVALVVLNVAVWYTIQRHGIP